MRRNRLAVLMFTLSTFLAACGEGAPSVRFTSGDLLLRETFDNPYAWESYVDPVLGVDFAIADGEYRAQAEDEGFIWTLSPSAYSDIVIQVDTQIVSDDENNAYGLMCRASSGENYRGYFFFISSDGYYTIRRGDGTGIAALIEWTAHGAIQQGRNVNRMRVVCASDWLALYVNGEFVAETRDTLYSRGSVGLTAIALEGDRTDARFDDLTIWEASITEPEP